MNNNLDCFNTASDKIKKLLENENVMAIHFLEYNDVTIQMKDKEIQRLSDIFNNALEFENFVSEIVQKKKFSSAKQPLMKWTEEKENAIYSWGLMSKYLVNSKHEILFVRVIR